MNDGDLPTAAQNGGAARSVPSPTRALLLGLALVGLDAFLFNQGVIALVVAASVVLVGAPRALLAKKFQGVRGRRLTCLAIYLVAVAMVFGLNAFNNKLAHRRAGDLISAVEAFHADQGRYPRSLSELVPSYIDEVPAAKYTLAFDRFWYYADDENATLLYVAFPPFGRPTYSFARGEWRSLD